jgi:lipopolysaccharide/colanic/teichoic acid biosynthesis glycosyltransferase
MQIGKMTINKNKYLILKRISDVIGSGIGLIILLPIFVVIGILIKFDSKGPVFFVQGRAGKDRKIFKTYKLRTMVENAEKKGLKYRVTKDDRRITRIGKHLRWGIDELPQLINVFKGEMSLVGPRPTLPYQVEKYSEREKRRLEVKPGITGWALINGRNKLSWPERIKLDIWYIDHWSLWLDLKILFKTIWVVIFTREGIYGEDGVTRDYEREI